MEPFTMRRRYLWYATLPLVVACADPTVPVEPRVTVLVQRDTVTATRSSASLGARFDFTIPLTIHNADSRPVELVGCTEAIETPAGGEWRTVWSVSNCALAAGSTSRIQPGGTVEVMLSVGVMPGQSGERWANDTFDGIYRVTLGVIAEGSSGVIPRIGSNSFVLLAP
jgi:hypothetical protein